jgi:hypothetical protein
MVVPVVAHTSSFRTEVYIRNSDATDLTVDVKFYEANNSPVPGLRPCNQMTVPANSVGLLVLNTQCTLGAGSHFGMLILEDAAAEKIHSFAVYSRSQTSQGRGFSVEAIPAGYFSAGNAASLGLKRVAGPPVRYDTNCFAGALGEAVSYRITLFDGLTNAQIGNNIDGTLQPYENIRHLDVFTVAAAPAGDYTNVRARFSNTAGDGRAFVGFCTVEEHATLAADFRIARSFEANDNAQRRLICYAQSPCGTVDSSTNITDVTKKQIHWLILHQPDYVKCELVSPRLADLEIQLRGPGDPFLAPVFATSPPYSSGGNGATSFYIFTGHRGQVNAGFTTRWYIDVSFREGGNATVPIPYGITCNSGNGVTVPWFRATDVDSF